VTYEATVAVLQSMTAVYRSGADRAVKASILAEIIWKANGAFELGLISETETWFVRPYKMTFMVLPLEPEIVPLIRQNLNELLDTAPPTRPA